MKHAWLLVGILAGCILFVYLLVPPASYEPGPLMQAHASLDNRCATCHTPWLGVTSQACISCHGDFARTNAHAHVKVAGTRGDLIGGQQLTSFSNSLKCLSCHVEHMGRRPDLQTTATFACVRCHRHPSIEAVPQHNNPMRRPTPATTMFSRPFSHSDHANLLAVEVLDCQSCHELTATAPGREMKFSFKWKGCAGSTCHANPQELGLPDSIGTAPETIASLVQVRHIDATFVHSPGHLRSKCMDCHTMIGQSEQETDTEARTVARCFTCHTHQSDAVDRQRSSTVTAVAAATISTTGGSLRLVSCGSCHIFHRHGSEPTFDFVSNPPKSAPPGLAKRHAIMLSRFTFPRTIGFLSQRQPEQFWPWWPGVLALVMIGVAAIGTWRIVPGLLDFSRRPTDASSHRMHEVPALDDQFQSSIRGLYIIGETAGTASINFAMRSGREVVAAIANQLRHQPPVDEADVYDVAIVGCGPAGLGATATAAVMGLKYCTLEKMTAVSTIRTFPRSKFVHATPISLEEYGSFFLEGDNSKEDLIAEWEKIIARADLVINDREEVVNITSERGRFNVVTANQNVFKTRYVILAIGVRGTPRRLGLRGEETGRVFYHLIEADEFKNKKILVVGGGNAGAEVTQSLAAPALGNQVSYSFRDPALAAVTRENAEKISALQQSNAIRLYPSTVLSEIRPGAVVLRPMKAAAGPSAEIVLDNDVIFAMIGAQQPIGFLKAIRVRVTKKGEA
jgi:thioredoxin reductase (NADPH)